MAHHFTSVQAASALSRRHPSRPGGWRRLLATVGVLLAVAALALPTLQTVWHITKGERSLPAMTDLVFWSLCSLPVLAVAASAWLLHVPRLPAQLAARASWWALLLVGSVGVLSAHGSARDIACAAVLGAAIALLAMGRLELGSHRFAPLRHRGALLGSLVLALADASTLLFWGALAAMGALLHGGEDASVAALFYLPSGALMLVAVIGVYRLRVWGLVLNVVGNAGVALAVLAWDPGHLPLPLRVPLVATAVLQLALFVPLLSSLAGRRCALEAWRGWPALPTAIVLGVVCLDLASVLLFAEPPLRL